MIYMMDTKVFCKEYAKESRKTIKHSQFVVVSNRIRKSDNDPRVNFLRELYPPDMILADYRNQFDHENLERNYKDYARSECLLGLAVIVEAAITEDYPVIFLCTPLEMQMGYMKWIRDIIEKEFRYPVLDYHKHKRGKDSIDPTVVSKKKSKRLCREVIVRKEREDTMKSMQSARGRLKRVEGMKKSELKKELRRISQYYEGMTKSEMKETLAVFWDASSRL